MAYLTEWMGWIILFGVLAVASIALVVGVIARRRRLWLASALVLVGTGIGFGIWFLVYQNDAIIN